MQKARRDFIFRNGMGSLAFCVFLSTLGCVNLVTKPFKLYDGPILPPDKIAVLVCVLNVQVNVDEQENVNPESHKVGSRLEMLPGTHRVGIRPYLSFLGFRPADTLLGPGEKKLPVLLPEDAIYFDAVAGKTYKVITEQTNYDKTEISHSDKEATYLLTNVDIRFHIVEAGSNKVVSRRTS